MKFTKKQAEKLLENQREFEKHLHLSFDTEYLSTYQTESMAQIKKSLTNFTEDPQILLSGLDPDYLQLNIGGDIFTTTIETITSYQGSYLTDLFTGKMGICLDRNGVPFIDRDGEFFGYVLDYLRDGEVILPDDSMVTEMIMKEFEFYKIKIKAKVQQWQFSNIQVGDVKSQEDKNLTLTNTTGEYEFAIASEAIKLPPEEVSHEWTVHIENLPKNSKFAFGVLTKDKKLYHKALKVAKLKQLVLENKPRTRKEFIKLLEKHPKLKKMQQQLDYDDKRAKKLSLMELEKKPAHLYSLNLFSFQTGEIFDFQAKKTEKELKNHYRTMILELEVKSNGKFDLSRFKKKNWLLEVEKYLQLHLKLGSMKKTTINKLMKSLLSQSESFMEQKLKFIGKNEEKKEEKEEIKQEKKESVSEKSLIIGDKIDDNEKTITEKIKQVEIDEFSEKQDGDEGLLKKMHVLKMKAKLMVFQKAESMKEIDHMSLSDYIDAADEQFGEEEITNSSDISNSFDSSLISDNDVDDFAQYQSLKCYNCGKSVNGKMTICQNNSDPGRNDIYGRDGFTACCPDHVTLIGVEPYFQAKVGGPNIEEKIIEKKGKIQNAKDKYQHLLCYQCGQNQNGSMIVCINTCDANRSDVYGIDGFTACCPNCTVNIGTKNYFSCPVPTDNEDETDSDDESQPIKTEKMLGDIFVSPTISEESSDDNDCLPKKEKDEKISIQKVEEFLGGYEFDFLSQEKKETSGDSFLDSEGEDILDIIDKKKTKQVKEKKQLKKDFQLLFGKHQLESTNKNQIIDQYDRFLRKTVQNFNKKVFSVGDYSERKRVKLSEGISTFKLEIKKVSIKRFNDYFVIEMKHGKGAQKCALETTHSYLPFIEIYTKGTSLKVTF